MIQEENNKVLLIKKSQVYCTNCGHGISIDAKFCTACGINLIEHRAENAVIEFIKELDETDDFEEKEKIIRAFQIPDEKKALSKIVELSVHHLTKEMEREEEKEIKEEEKYDKVFYAWVAKLEQCYAKITLWPEHDADIVLLGETYRKDYDTFFEEKKRRQKSRRMISVISNIETVLTFIIIAVYAILWYKVGLTLWVLGIGYFSFMITLSFDKIAKRILQKKRKRRLAEYNKQRKEEKRESSTYSV